VIVNDDWGIIQKEAIVAILRYYPSFCLGGLGKTSKILRHDGLYLHRDKNLGLPEQVGVLSDVW
jgi:hypothetical protein